MRSQGIFKRPKRPALNTMPKTLRKSKYGYLTKKDCLISPNLKRHFCNNQLSSAGSESIRSREQKIRRISDSKILSDCTVQRQWMKSLQQTNNSSTSFPTFQPALSHSILMKPSIELSQFSLSPLHTNRIPANQVICPQIPHRVTQLKVGEIVHRQK